MKSYLVAGGAGFLGSYVSERLLLGGNRVVVIDNFSTGSPNNATLLTAFSECEVFHLDICDAEAMKRVSDERFDAVLNFACPANPPYCFTHSIDVTRANTIGLFHLLDIAKACGAVFFQSSSSEVYGNADVLPQSEDYVGHVNPYGIRACYDEGKRCAESLCYDYHRYYGLDVRVARIFNTYGPRMNPVDGRIVVQFMQNALCGNPLIIYGSGVQTRSLCYVDDMIEGILQLMFTKEMPPHPINLGSKEELSVIDIAHTILHVTGSNSEIVFEAGTPDDPQRRCPDISLARQLLGWTPLVSFETGIKNSLPYFQMITSCDKNL